MDVDSLVAEFRRFFKPGSCLETLDKDSALKLAHCLRRFLHEDVLQAVRDHADSPIVACYQADGWGTFIRDTRKLRLSDSSICVTSNGRFRHEFINQHLVLRINTRNGKQVVKHLFEEPIGLKFGKRTGHCYTAATEFWKTLKSYGHRGVVDFGFL